MSNIYEILIRGDDRGGFIGGHIIYYGDPLPQSFSSIKDVENLDWLKCLGDRESLVNEKESLKLDLDNAMEQIALLQLELCPDIASVTPALLIAGLIAWGDRAVEAYNKINPEGSDSLTPSILKLHTIAMEPRSVTQCRRMREVFGDICMKSNVIPTQDETFALQSILDDAEIDRKWINFLGI